MLIDAIKQGIIESLKAKETVKLETYRFLLSAIRYLAIAKYGAEWETKITDADVLEVVKKQVKTHKESMSAFEKAGRAQLYQKEKDQLAFLEVMLPKELSDDELTAIIKSVVSQGEKNFGVLMRTIMEQTNGRADGGRVSTLLRTILGS